MVRTADPLLDGPVPAPAGARINAQDQRSADDTPFVVDRHVAGAAISR
jgi:hypothetical protein